MNMPEGSVAQIITDRAANCVGARSLILADEEISGKHGIMRRRFMEISKKQLVKD